MKKLIISEQEKSEIRGMYLINEFEDLFPETFLKRRLDEIENLLDHALDRVDPIENNYTIFEDYKDEVIWQTWDDMNEKYGNDEDNPPPVKADLFFKLIELKFLDKIKNRWKKFKIR
jgi:hypothetical protein